jgi:hypothetical protein
MAQVAKDKRSYTSNKKAILGHSVQPLLTYKPVGKKGHFDELSVSTLSSILGQRITSDKKVRSFLKKANGFDWALYSPILVARIDNKDSSYSYYVYDGDHRKEMFLLTFGPEAKIPCWVTDFDNMTDVAVRFNQINARRRTSVTQEQQFICDYFAGNQEVKELSKTLSKFGLRVADDKRRVPDGFHEVPLYSSDPAISANALRQCVKVSGTSSAFKDASALLKRSFPNDSEIFSELIQSLTLFLKTYENEFAKSTKRVPNPFANFATFFITVASTKANQKDLANMWKFAGGRIHHKEKECTALGILDGFLQSPQGKLLKTLFRRRKLENLI